MSVEIVNFEIADDKERVFIQWSNGKYTEEKVYHVGEDGVLCDDMETYLEYADYEVAV